MAHCAPLSQIKLPDARLQVPIHVKEAKYILYFAQESGLRASFVKNLMEVHEGKKTIKLETHRQPEGHSKGRSRVTLSKPTKNEGKILASFR